jgi:tRNA synthetases class I (C) catalytic domain
VSVHANIAVQATPRCTLLPQSAPPHVVLRMHHRAVAPASPGSRRQEPVRGESRTPTAPAIDDRYIDEFHEDMQQLGCLPPALEPRATAHIPAMIDTISKIIDNGHAYTAGNDVFFDIATLPGYGKLSRHTPQVHRMQQQHGHALLLCWRAACRLRMPPSLPQA